MEPLLVLLPLLPLPVNPLPDIIKIGKSTYFASEAVNIIELVSMEVSLSEHQLLLLIFKNWSRHSTDKVCMTKYITINHIL